jgi:hypothetical protein
VKRGVLLPVLIQDPFVAGQTEARSIVHPVIVKDPAGFTEGPACRRVAVVDLDFHTGRLRGLAGFDPRGSPYRDIAAYRVAIPTKRGTGAMPWTRGYGKGTDVERLGFVALDDPFMKVSVFGTVLRTIGLVQDPAVLGREVTWAFPGQQLLVVPRAAEMDNAFYHRDSRSLQFYYGSTAHGPTVYLGLSQDIVAHETAHAIIDGIAPDLYDAISPESLAIHEGLADLTAALLSMRNRELTHKPGRAIDTDEFQRSSRFSRIAEEFGRWRGHGDALRDICNTKSLDPAAALDRRVDLSSPHSTSEVWSGLLFSVFRTLFVAAPKDPEVERKIKQGGSAAFEGLRYRIAYACNRTLGLAYRGLDWLPPGDASFADLVAAMLAAEREFFPDDARVREALSREAGLRGIAAARADGVVTRVDVPSSAAARRAFVERHREALGIPAEARATVSVRSTHVYTPPLIPRSTSESFDLKPDISRWVSAGTEHVLIKLAWWQRETNDLGGWGTHRRYRAGATIVAEKGGRVRVVLQNRTTPAAAASRSAFLGRMLADQPVRPPIGPDGAPLQRGLRVSLDDDTLFISGAMQALHVVGDLD